MKLNDRQHAEPGQCGSCQHFRRRDDSDSMGTCEYKLPPWIMKYFEPSARVKQNAQDYMGPMDTVMDTESCSIYTRKMICGSPAQFVQEHIWEAGNPSR